MNIIEIGYISRKTFVGYRIHFKSVIIAIIPHKSYNQSAS